MNLANFGLDDIHGLVPRDRLPLVETSILRIAFERRKNALVVVNPFGQRQAANAQTTVGDRMLRVTFCLDHLSVLNG